MSSEKPIEDLEDLGDLGDLLRGPNSRKHLLMLLRACWWIQLGAEIMADEHDYEGYERRAQWMADAKHVVSKLREILKIGLSDDFPGEK